MLHLSRREIEEHLGMGEVLDVVKQAFRPEGERQAIMPSKLNLDLPKYQGNFMAIPASNGSACIRITEDIICKLCFLR